MAGDVSFDVAGAAPGSFVLSFDFEDWHQLVNRSVGVHEGGGAGSTLERQTARILDLLDELEVKATFFVLGLVAERYPGLIAELARRGHEIGCHGYGHDSPSRQTIQEFRADVQRSLDAIRCTCDARITGYRAPTFGIDRISLPEVYEVLCDLGFEYDSSLYDSPLIRRRVKSIPAGLSHVQLASARELWEFPIAACRFGSRTIPVGGGSYWRVLPGPVLWGGLERVGRSCAYPALYFHPYECDPQPLRASTPASATLRQQARCGSKSLYRNAMRHLIVPRIREMVARHRLVTHAQALAETRHGPHPTVLREERVYV
jgi:polysaccharide deacetylase family protein (PEP-CTERM system associated)